MSNWKAIIVFGTKGAWRYDLTETGKLRAKFPRQRARHREQMWLDLAEKHSHRISQSPRDLPGVEDEQSHPMPIGEIWASLGDTESLF
jgi:hypothetical protein